MFRDKNVKEVEKQQHSKALWIRQPPSPPFPFRQQGDHDTVNSQQVDLIKTMSHFLSHGSLACQLAFLAELDRSFFCLPLSQGAELQWYLCTVDEQRKRLDTLDEGGKVDHLSLDARRF